MTPVDLLSHLAVQVRHDPVLALANVVVWLDPAWDADQNVFEDDSDEQAWWIVRQNFPSLYAEVIQLLRNGATRADIERRICTTLTQMGIEINELEEMAYGIPLTAVGVNISTLETYDTHPDLKAIVELFGIQPDENVFGVVISDSVFQTGRRMVETLSHHAACEWRQVGMALAWVFSCSGNSLIDYDMDELYEMESLEWTQTDIAFAIEMIAEADRMMAEVVAGLVLLEKDAYRQDLKRMIRKGMRHDELNATNVECA